MHCKDFLRAGHPPTLLSAFLYFDVSFMIWVVLGALAPAIAQDFGLTATQKGLIVGVPLLGGSLFRLVLGPLTDVIGPRRTGALGMVLTLVPLLWGWLGARTLPELLALGLLLGVAGASFAVALPMASRWYPPQHQGLALGVAGAGNSGTVLASLFAPGLAAAVGWHATMGLFTLPLAAVLAIFLLLARDAPNQPRPPGVKAYWQMLRRTDTRRFCLLYSVTFGGFVGLASFLPTFFVDQYQLSPVDAGLFATGCVVAGSFVRPLGGFLADRMGGSRLLRLLLLVVAAGAAGVAQLPPLPAVAGVLFVAMAAMGMGNGAVFQLVPQHFPRGIGTVTGIVGAAGGVGGYLLPFGLGALKDLTGSFAGGFYAFALAAALLPLVLMRLQFRQPTAQPETRTAH